VFHGVDSVVGEDIGGVNGLSAIFRVFTDLYADQSS
jgi:hypothetical protein